MHTIGLISDTHGLLRPQALAALQGVEHIVHAGDIGSADVLTQLAAIAPLTAVRGNNDKGDWAAQLPLTCELTVAGQRIFVLHDIAELADRCRATGYAAVIAGHSHRASIAQRQGTLFVNPGSAGPRRFKLPITLATLRVSQSEIQASIHTLEAT